jgi:AmmeMemoRadiSam system protein B
VVPGGVERPRLRALEAFPVEQDGRRAVGLRDPAGFTEQVAVLPIPLLDLVSLFDGEHSVEEMREIFRGRHGDAPSAEQIRGIVEQMDEAGFLDSPRFAARRRAVEEAFSRSPVRPAAHAGVSYPREPGALRSHFASLFEHPEGPGAPGPVILGPDGAPASSQRLRALIAPHIDFHRGGPTYAWAYRDIARSEADLFVILGTCHAGMQDPFSTTLKPFETPLGAAATDREFLDALGRRYGEDLLASEGAHRAEHSVEFQVVMLQHLLAGRRDFTIVPLLASFLHEAVWRGDAPEGDPRVPRFLEALGETLAASGRRVCLVAGVDLAHVGPRFGDAEPNTEESLRRVEEEDRAMLAAVTAGDAGGFFEAVARDGDARRICGLSPLYTFLRALPGARGRLLRYSQWPDPEGAVSFCAAVFP